MVERDPKRGETCLSLWINSLRSLNRWRVVRLLRELCSCRLFLSLTYCSGKGETIIRITINFRRSPVYKRNPHSISVPVAFVFAIVLGVLGFGILWFWVNAYAFLFAVIGFVVYVGFYSLWTKRTTIHQTVVGSISGAAPPVIGYTAVANQFDIGALLIFLGYALWQMPHSWAIAIYRFDDYKNAGIPILPVARSIQRTKIESLIYVILFIVAMNGLFVFGYTNWI